MVIWPEVNVLMEISVQYNVTLLKKSSSAVGPATDVVNSGNTSSTE